VIKSLSLDIFLSIYEGLSSSLVSHIVDNPN